MGSERMEEAVLGGAVLGGESLGGHRGDADAADGGGVPHAHFDLHEASFDRRSGESMMERDSQRESAGHGVIAMGGELIMRGGKALIHPMAHGLKATEHGVARVVDVATHKISDTLHNLTSHTTYTVDQAAQLVNLRGFLTGLQDDEDEQLQQQTGGGLGHSLLETGGALVSGSKSLAKHLHRYTVGGTGEALDRTLGVAKELARGVPLERTLQAAKKGGTKAAKAAKTLAQNPLGVAEQLATGTLATGEQLAKGTFYAADKLAAGTLQTGETLAKGTLAAGQSLVSGFTNAGESAAVAAVALPRHSFAMASDATERLSRLSRAKQQVRSVSARWRSRATGLVKPAGSLGGGHRSRELMLSPQRAHTAVRPNVRREAELQAEQQELTRHLEEAHTHIVRLVSLLIGLGLASAGYDAIAMRHAYAAYPEDESYTAHQLTRSLIIRAAGLVLPSVVLLAYVCIYTPWTRNRTIAAAALFSGLPGLSIAGVLANTHVEVQPCAAIVDVLPPPCDDVFAANATAFACLLAADDEGASAELYCEQAPVAYLTTLLLMHAFLPYTFTYAIDLPVLMTLAALGSAIGLLAVVWAETLLREDRHFVGLDASRWVRLLLIVGWAHALGVAHHFARRIDVLEASALRLRQQRQLREIAEETERTEKLLANIVPPHLIGQLKERLLVDTSEEGSHKKDGAKSAEGDGDDAGTAEARRRLKSRSRWREAFAKLKRAKSNLSGLGPLRVSKQIEGMGVLVAESYADCSILFAKLEGLELLVNNDERAPVEVVTLLQRVFDKFDALADIYGVQKVRKTANEQSIFAAGLPDGTLLPSPSLRACGLAAFGFALIAVMEKLNVELRMWGIPLKLQVGIHSGAVIAGVIGHKTVQWDLCGDAVNTAARMCTYSKPGHVHVSEATYELAKGCYAAVHRGERAIKGKGLMRTYFLLNMPADALDGVAAAGLALPTTGGAVVPAAQLPEPSQPSSFFGWGLTGSGSTTPKKPGLEFV